MRALRRGKQELALLVGIADLGGYGRFERVTEALAAYADAACACCVRWLLAQAADIRQATCRRIPPIPRKAAASW